MSNNWEAAADERFNQDALDKELKRGILRSDQL